MKQTGNQIKKLIETYLNVECVHNIPVKSVKSEIVSTYDGDYPVFIIEYNCEMPENVRYQKDDLTEGIEKYTNLIPIREHAFTIFAVPIIFKSILLLIFLSCIFIGLDRPAK
jgi:hypothetical protein